MVAKYSGKLRVERDGVTSALLVLNNTTGEGILVNSEGSAYARYSAYLPFAKPYLDYEIARIADYCVSEGAENTSDGLWAITFDEVCEHFNIDLSDNPEIRDDLLDILRTREEIAEIVATDDEFEIKYSMDGLRHTCGSLMVEHGVDPETVKTVLGHESLKTTNRYLHPYAESMKDASEKMERIIRGKADGETPIHLSSGE